MTWTCLVAGMAWWVISVRRPAVKATAEPPPVQPPPELARKVRGDDPLDPHYRRVRRLAGFGS